MQSMQTSDISAVASLDVTIGRLKTIYVFKKYMSHLPVSKLFLLKHI